MMRRIGTITSLALVLLGAFVLPPCGRRAEAAPPGPDSPGDHFWRRNVAGPGPQLGAMGRRIEEIAEAFGRGEFAQARRLAEAVLDSTEEVELRAEAAAFVVQSHLAEGDVEAARAAAERIGDQESLARISRIEAEYKAEVGRLQRIVATTEDAAEAARAQLLTARAHEAACRLGLAEQSYWKVIERYSDCPEAGDALWHIARLHCARGRSGQALAACVSAAQRFPNSLSLAATGTERIARLPRAHGETAQAREMLLHLTRRFPDTAVSAFARFRTGDLHWVSGQADRAADAWQYVWQSEAYAPGIPDLLDRLAEARYRAGTEFLRAGECDYALVQFLFLAHMPDTHWRREHVVPAALTLDMAECYLALGDYGEVLALARKSHGQTGEPESRARALYLEGCAHWELRDYSAAADAWLTATEQYAGAEWADRSRGRMMR